MKRLLITAIAYLALSMNMQGQTAVTSGMMYGKKYGVTYMLPKTQFMVKATATLHQFIPGEFSKYADLYLHLKDVKTQPETYWTLDEGTVTSIGVPDKEKIYFVELKDKTVAPLMELTEQGTIYSINLPIHGNDKKDVTPAPTPKTDLPDPRTFFTEEILSANSTAKMAELVAEEIYTIRESKNALLRGESDNMPKDGAQLQIMLNHLNQQEESLLSLFVGKNDVKTYTQTFSVSPEGLLEEVAFRFSTKEGIVERDNLVGDPVYITMANQGLITPPSDEEKPKKELEGVAYNVPGKANVTLIYRRQRLFDGELPVTQLGTVEYLANVLFNKNSTTTVQFDAETGALRKVDKEER